MLNIFISILYLIITFTLTLLCYKKYGKYGLYIWMCLLVIISNIQTIKIATILGLTVSLGNISYGAIFLTTDILSENYGKETTNNATKLSFIAMIVFALIMFLFLQYEPSINDNSQSALLTIFGFMPRITLVSLISYFFSQRCDAFLYRFLKEKYDKVWISNIFSTLISQVVDTIIFVFGAFIGIMNYKNIFELIITMLLFKWLIALLDTPFMIISTKIKNKELE